MEQFKHLLDSCGHLLAVNGLTIAFAESATAGKLSYEFSKAENSGKILRGSCVCYDACVKEEILKVSSKLVEEFTPESAEVTKEMALKLKDVINADVLVAVTGLTKAGGSETPAKPVGTMFYCINFHNTFHERKKIFDGSPEKIIDLTIEQIIKTIISVIR